MKTIEQRLKEIIGEHVFTIAGLATQVESLQERLAELTKKEVKPE